MSLYDQARIDFENILTNHGEVITLKHLTSGTSANTRGDLSSPTYTDTTPMALIQPVNIEELTAKQMGYIDEGAIIIYIDHNNTITTNDLIVRLGKVWKIVSIETQADVDDTVYLKCVGNPISNWS